MPRDGDAQTWSNLIAVFYQWLAPGAYSLTMTHRNFPSWLECRGSGGPRAAHGPHGSARLLWRSERLPDECGVRGRVARCHRAGAPCTAPGRSGTDARTEQGQIRIATRHAVRRSSGSHMVDPVDGAVTMYGPLASLDPSLQVPRPRRAVTCICRPCADMSDVYVKSLPLSLHCHTHLCLPIQLD